MSHQELEITFPSYNTIRATLTLADFDGTAISDCTSHDIYVFEPDGTQHSNETSPTNNGDGTYTQYFTLAIDDPEGVYKLDWRIIYATKPNREVVKFKVE